MQQITLMAWNIEGRLTDSVRDQKRSTPSRIIDAILRQQADVVYLPESTRGGQMTSAIRKRFERAGYEVFECAYDDPDRLADEPDAATYSAMLVRLPVVRKNTFRYAAQRTLPVARVRVDDRELTIAGIHFDDRSEESRLVQAEAFIAAHKMHPDIVALGDFNATHGKNIERIFHTKLYDIALKYAPHVFLRSVLVRARGMTKGTVLAKMIGTLSLKDADSARRSTATPKLRGYEWLPNIRVLQLDHILVPQESIVHNFSVLPDSGSDHRGIVCDIALDKTQ